MQQIKLLERDCGDFVWKDLLADLPLLPKLICILPQSEKESFKQLTYREKREQLAVLLN